MTDPLQQQLRDALGVAYTITRELSGGGMSRVFLAEEVALNRRVVVKVLPPETAAAISSERFRREIALAARLQHPHIVPLLTAGEAQGLPYFTMPFVEGESLRARLARHGELPVAEAIRLLREVASALQYAHERGVVHRDIKPDNVLLSGGSAMVTDFGIAKAISASSQDEGTPTHSGHTSHGVALGTPTYMSPEQASADPTVDHRADLYAFGVLAYETLTGQPPFAGRTPQGLLAAHITETPQSIQTRRANLPSGLAMLVMRCLEKRPADRPQTAAEIVHALDEVTTPSGGTPPAVGLPARSSATRPVSRRATLWMAAAACVVLVVVGGVVVRGRFSGGTAAPVMLAVLPFENQGPASDDYFGDGLADAITNRLASVPALGVIAQRSASQYKHSTKSLSEIGRELGVQYVLQGTVRWGAGSDGGRKAQVSPSLVRISDGTVRWAAEPYVVTPADVFSVQTEIASRVASSLDVEFSHASPASTAEGATANPAAYDAYLRGVEYSSQYFRDYFDPGAGALAAEQFQHAIHLDTSFALAEAKLAIVQSYQLWAHGGDSSVGNQLSRSVARALQLAPNLAEAHLAKGLLLQLVNTDLPASNAELHRALELKPGDAMILGSLGDGKAQLGDSTGLPMLTRSVELDPLNAATLTNAMFDFAWFRHFAEAERLARLWERLASDNPDPLIWEASFAIAARGDTAQAMRLWAEAERRATMPTNAMVLAYPQLPQGARRLLAITLPTMLARTTWDTANYYIAKGSVLRRAKGVGLGSAYGDSLRSLALSIRPVPGVFGVQWAHGMLAFADWLSNRKDEFAREADATVSELAKYGERTPGLALWVCDLGRDYAGIGDVPNAVSYGRRCLTLPSGETAWNIRLDPEWQGVLSDPRVQALLREFPPKGGGSSGPNP